MATFKGFWHGPPLGITRIACLNSFIARGHKFQIYTYKHFPDIPAGVEIKDANEIIPENEVIWFSGPGSCNSNDLGPFSDLFRIKMLYEQGGWWCDVDTVCLREDIADFDEAWSQESPDLNSDEVGNGQVCLNKGGELASELYRRSQTIKQNPLERRESMGPLLWSQTIADLGLEKSKNANANLFYPYRWIEMFKLWLPEYREEVVAKTKDSYFLPIYQSFPAHAGLDLLRIPPRGSYLYQFLSEHKGDLDIDEKSIYEVGEVRKALRKYLQDNSSWIYEELTELCGPQILKELKLKPQRHPLNQRLKAAFKKARQRLNSSFAN